MPNYMFGPGSIAPHRQPDDREVLETLLRGELLSPEDYDRQPDLVKQTFGSYMNYLQTHQLRKKQITGAREAYQSVGRGEFEPTPFGTGRVDLSEVRRGNAAREAAIPRTAVHYDMYGNPVTEAVGAGVRTGMLNRRQYATPEAIRGAGEARLAIPRVEQEIKNQAQAISLAPSIRSQQRIRQELVLQEAQDEAQIKAGLTPEQRYGLTKTGQAMSRLDLQRQRLEQQDKQFQERMTYDEYMTYLRDELRQGQMKLAFELTGARDKKSREFQSWLEQARGNLVGTPEQQQKAAQGLENALVIINQRAGLTKDANERRLLAQQEAEIDRQLFMLQKAMVTASFMTTETKTEGARLARNLRTQKAELGAPREVERQVPDGRIAIFNADTQQFIRYK